MANIKEVYRGKCQGKRKKNLVPCNFSCEHVFLHSLKDSLSCKLEKLKVTGTCYIFNSRKGHTNVNMDIIIDPRIKISIPILYFMNKKQFHLFWMLIRCFQLTILHPVGEENKFGILITTPSLYSYFQQTNLPIAKSQLQLLTSDMN